MRRSNFILIYICLFWASCTPKNKIAHSPLEAANIITYLALGDSYTIGERVAEEDRWPVQLAAQLRQKGHLVKTPKIIAKTGWTTDELAAGILAENSTEKFGLVSLLIGVNNQYRGRDIEEFRVQYKELLNTAVQYADGNTDRVFVVSIPDWGAMPFAADRDQLKIAKEIDVFNSVKKDETEKLNILFIDITDISRKATKDLQLVADDQLHPSEKMYKQWVDKILPRAEGLLQ